VTGGYGQEDLNSDKGSWKVEEQGFERKPVRDSKPLLFARVEREDVSGGPQWWAAVLCDIGKNQKETEVEERLDMHASQRPEAKDPKPWL